MEEADKLTDAPKATKGQWTVKRCRRSRKTLNKPSHEHKRGHCKPSPPRETLEGTPGLEQAKREDTPKHTVRKLMVPNSQPTKLQMVLSR